MRPGMRAVLLALAAVVAGLAVRSVHERARLRRLDVVTGAWRIGELVPLECPPGCSCRGVLAVLDEIEQRGRAA